MKKFDACFIRNNLFALLVLLLPWLSSCSKEDAPVYEKPTLTLQGENILEVKRGEPIVVNLELNAEGGNGQLLVYRNGGLLEMIDLERKITQYTYSSQSVPLTAEEGELFEYEFSLVNTQDLESDRVPLTVSTIAYETIQVGTLSLYQVEIPEDGIISSGRYRFVKDRKYFISKTMTFQTGTSLLAEEGVHLFMNADSETPVDIVIESGAEVNIAGTAGNPVVFTSSKQTTEEAVPGDWGQLSITGSGVGSNSGIIAYLRIEYPGNRAFRLSNVGSGTSISHIQVFKSSGEGIMPTDGDVNLKYIIGTDCQGGAFRFGDAYAGKVQFALAWLSQQFAENEQFTIREEASPIVSNVTVLGPGTATANTHGMRLRAASQAKVYNSIIAEFPRRGLRLNDQVVVTDLNGPTVFAYSYIFNVPVDPYRDDTANGNPFQGHMDGETLVNPFFNNITGFQDGKPVLSSIPGIGVGDFLPDSETTSNFNPSSIASFFENAPYVGAFKDGNSDWTIGWVKNTDGSIR